MKYAMKKNYLEEICGFKGKVVLVTGATGQLGQEICKAYERAGARVIGTDKVLAPSMIIKSSSVKYLEMDITNLSSIKSTFAGAMRKYKRIDILVNNAGVSTFEPFEERPEKSFDWVMDVNLKGTFFCIQTYINLLKAAKKRGCVVNIASIYGNISSDFRIYTDCPRKNSEVYGATKAGIIQMSKYFGVHAAQFGIRVNCISPGGIFNPRNPQGKDFIKNYSFRCPMGRMAEAREMTGAVLFLSSDSASYITGQNLLIDGGMSCW